ncbi:alpha/beta hydrolase [Dongia rigui]|uniref:Alpha/beta fold hydrolase n=1 Tax=Dongia rigui TaxID=940149 RepID=A0ABU5DVQ0_9PROT|nr:alpha/beta fold hydrolase [Dongia rigui]MDY0871391.1 alpha/beta fold hydrolase [Dongia rigui]
MQAGALFTESEINAGPLGGVLVAVPDAAARPIALILPGSGPTDRDGNNPLGIQAAPYRLLAHALGNRGISSVRIDKRGLFSSAGATADANAVTIADYVDDAGVWLNRIGQVTDAKDIWLIGHSEGGLIALATALACRRITGLILLATPGRRLGAILRSQLMANPANAALLDQAMQAIDALERGVHVDDTTLHPALMPLFRGEVQSFLIDALSYDPIDLLRRVAVPVLVLQGDKDLQVDTEDACLLAAARPGVDVLIPPGVNHVLKTVTTDDRAANLAAYGDPNLPLSPAIADAISDYINNRRQPQ